MSTEEKQLYSVSIYTENNIGLLNRISAIFQRRHINIESLNTSPSEIEGVSKFTIVVNMSEVNIKKILGQIEKQVEVIKSYYHMGRTVLPYRGWREGRRKRERKRDRGIEGKFLELLLT